MIAAWLFLYLGGLIHVLAVYGLEFQSLRSAILLLPILLLPLPVLLKRHRPNKGGDLFPLVSHDFSQFIHELINHGIHGIH